MARIYISKIVLSLIMICLVACKSNEVIRHNDLLLSTDDITFMDDSKNILNFSWKINDQIAIFGNRDKMLYQYCGKDNDRSIFTYQQTSNKPSNQYYNFYTIYPYGAAIVSQSEGSIKINVPSEQLYKEGYINSNDVILYAVSKRNDSYIDMQNFYGCISFEVNSWTENYINEIQVKGNNNEYISGLCELHLSSGYQPQATFATDASHLIVLKSNSNIRTLQKWIKFYILVPPITFSKGVTITVKLSNGDKVEHSINKAIEIKQGIISSLHSFWISSDRPPLVVLTHPEHKNTVLRNILKEFECETEILNNNIKKQSEGLDLVYKYDGLIIPGGGSTNQNNYSDSCLARLFVENSKWVIGICHGHQIMNMGLGGTRNYITEINPNAHSHLKLYHKIDIEQNSRLYDILKTTNISPWSEHQLAIDKLSPKLKIVAKDPTDGIIEAVEGNFAIGYQFHPEHDTKYNCLLEDFVNKVKLTMPE